jgi:hypothetical protein
MILKKNADSDKNSSAKQATHNNSKLYKQLLKKLFIIVNGLAVACYETGTKPFPCKKLENTVAITMG